MTAILAGGFLPGVKPHWRWDSIFNTAGCIGSKPVSFFRIKGNDRFDESDRTDGDQIFHFFTKILVFSYDMCYKPQITLNENVLCFQITLGVLLKVILFFVRREGIGKCLQGYTS